MGTRFLVTYIKVKGPFDGQEFLVVNGSAFTYDVEYDTCYDETDGPYDHTFYPVEDERIIVSRCKLKDIPPATLKLKPGEWSTKKDAVEMRSTWCYFSPPAYDSWDMSFEERIATLFFSPVRDNLGSIELDEDLK
jgi:hypothetical protein